MRYLEDRADRLANDPAYKEGRVERNIAAIIEDKIQLDLCSAGPRHIGDVKFITIR